MNFIKFGACWLTQPTFPGMSDVWCQMMMIKMTIMMTEKNNDKNDKDNVRQ